MEVVGLYQAKTRLSELVRDALSGETVIISRNGKPAVKLVPVENPKAKRSLGYFAGKVKISPDFDETPDDFSEYK